MERFLIVSSFFCLLPVASATQAALASCPRAFREVPFSCQCLSYGIVCNGSGDSASLGILEEVLVRSNQSISLLELHLNSSQRLSVRFLGEAPLVGLKVTNSGVSSVADGAFQGLRLEALSLAGNNLSVVPSRALAPLTHLERLDLAGNRIEEIGARAFEALAELRFLDLSDNSVVQISSGAFLGSVRLERLDLSGCRLHRSPAVPPSLRWLSLSRCHFFGRLDSPFPESLFHLDLSVNAITEVGPGAFTRLRNLQTLDLSMNALNNLTSRSFDETVKLGKLDLSSNDLETLPAGVQMPAITALRLDSNYFQKIPWDFLLGAPRVEEVSLRDNNIRSIGDSDVDILRRLVNLRSLMLNDNLLSCACVILPVASWLVGEEAARLTPDSRESVVCEEPLHLQGTPLVDLRADDLTCEQEPATPTPLDDYFDRMRHIEGLLREHGAEDGRLRLSWHLVDPPLPYKCDSLFVWEEQGGSDHPADNFLQYEVECNSRRASDPRVLSVLVDLSELRPSTTYHVCLVLFSRDHPLVLCSDSLHWQPPLSSSPASPSCPDGVSFRQAGDGAVAAWHIQEGEECEAEVTIWFRQQLVRNSSSSCSANALHVSGLATGPVYDACVSFGTVCGKTCSQLSLAGRGFPGPLIAGLATGLVALILLVVVACLLLKRRYKRHSRNPRYKVLLESRNSLITIA